jgi:hypothetical protein
MASSRGAVESFSRSAAVPAIVVIILIVSGLLSSQAASALVTCNPAGHDSQHRYSDGITTCYNENALAGIWQPDYSFGSFQVGVNHVDHVNADAQVVTIPNGYQVEVGWWDGAMNFCGGCNQTCYYGAQTNGGGYGDTCGVYTNASPSGPNRFHIEYAGFSGGWNHWNAKVDVSTIFTSIGQGSVSQMGIVGMEEQSPTWPSPNYSPRVYFSQLQFSDPVTCGLACISYQNWTPYSYCFVQYSDFEGFTAGPFPTNFAAAIGNILPAPNPPCTGSPPSPPGNTQWR